MDQIIGSLVACPECDALHRRRPLRRGDKARCVRCGTVLYRNPRLRPDQILPLVVCALVTFGIANVFPIVDLHVQGLHSSSTLFGSILALWGEERQMVAALVFATTLLFPLVDLSAMLALLLLSRLGRPAPLWRFVQALRPWGMIEVFMLGVLVALVKLSHLAHVLPGVALWAFAVLTILMVIILSYDPRSLWDHPNGGAS
jgi:paraquat-inducible protein A